MQNETQVIREVTNVKLQLLSNRSTTEEFMLVSVLPFRRTRYKSHLRADFIIPPHDGLEPLATAWSCQSIPSSHGAAHGMIFLHSPQDSAALLNMGMLRDWGLLWKWLVSAESERDEMSTPRVWKKWWQIGHRIDSVSSVSDSAWLGKHENGTSLLQSLIPSHIPRMMVVLCCQAEGPYLSGISDSLMEVAGRKYLINLKFSNSGTRFLNYTGV